MSATWPAGTWSRSPRRCGWGRSARGSSACARPTRRTAGAPSSRTPSSWPCSTPPAWPPRAGPRASRPCRASASPRRATTSAPRWCCCVPELRVCALYPDLMNIYADRGNLLFLRRRCEWRGIGFTLAGADPGDAVDPDAHDLFYLGGGQDRDQALCAHDLATVKRDALHAAAARGAVVFGVCGGHQLLGHAYELEGEDLPGV